MTRPLRLLAALAHPDDESLGFGGLLARYAAEGVETCVLTATRGQSGRFRGIKDGPEHPGPEALARIREAELRAAIRVLGVRELILLDYVDGRLDQAEPRAAIGSVAATIRRLQPQVVVTFAEDGGYGHPDHIAIGQFAAAGCVAAANPASELPGLDPALAPHTVSKFYKLAWAQPSWDAYQAAFKKLTATVDGIERQAVPWPDWMLTTEIDTRAHWEQVWKAVSCHDSQIAGYETLRHLAPEHHAALWGRTTLYRVFSTVNGGRRRETDLFEGLR